METIIINPNQVSVISSGIVVPEVVIKPASFTTNNLNDLIFHVEKIECQDFACNSDYAYDVFGYPNGIKTRLNCCSDRYELIPNAEVFNPVRDLLMDKGIKFDEEYQVFNNSRFYGKYRMMDFAHDMGNGDVIFPEMKVNHSYNGLTKYQITFGYFRLVCTNGLIIPVAEKSEFNLKITGKHTAKINKSLSELFEKVQVFTNQGSEVIQGFKDLSGHAVLNVGERIIEVMNATKLPIVENSNFNSIAYVTEIVEREAAKFNANDGKKVNDWLIYNGINQLINNNDRNSYVPESREKSDRAVYEFLANHF